MFTIILYNFTMWAANYSVRSVVRELMSGIRYDLSQPDVQNRLVLQPQSSYVMVEQFAESSDINIIAQHKTEEQNDKTYCVRSAT